MNMTTIKMKAEEVIGYCEKAIAYWMADRKNQSDIAPKDACIEFWVMIRGWNHKEIKKAEDLIGLAKLSSDTIDVGSDILEIIKISKKEFKPMSPWTDEDMTIDMSDDVAKPEEIDSSSWSGIKKLKNLFV